MPSISLNRMLIVADDLTGAADCGIACAGSGLQTVVSLDQGVDRIEADVIAVDADSRRMSAAKAGAIVGQLVRAQMREPRQLLYKKLDSTLRGNVGSEMAAALKAFCDGGVPDAEEPQGVVVVAPAFPKSGRITRGGRQFLKGAPLEETEIWRRGKMPGRANIPEILQTSGMRAELIGLSIVRSGPDRLRSKMRELRRSADALVCDAESDEDLQSIAIASVSLGPGIMWAGSAGLAHHLPAAAGIRSGVPAIVNSEPVAAGPTLIVVASLSTISREQVRALARDGRSICVMPRALHAGRKSSEWIVYEHEIRDAIKSGDDIVVHLGCEGTVDLGQGSFLSTALAKLAAPCANEIGGLVLAGGETAREVLKAFGVARLRLMGELEPGLPFSLTEGWKRRLPVLTKAGDFGNPQSLVHCRRYLRQLDRSCAPTNFCSNS